ncbi:hypothetical protein K2173_009080 [Erythroxylum novogranatense]|uniref:RING-type E3 ubiquitin transferase n=1 Tax=Erythroxylum novogranatense TaxID=1862640 RepID=A0AAV8TSW2_9ROSI|nr:hypothetical protein K2173_009080 [Erythroxylum novogranatense]
MELPCDGDGNCMICKNKPPTEEILTCKTCATPWHASCLSSPPPTMAALLNWDCPDCSNPNPNPIPVAPTQASSTSDLIAAIRAIENDSSLSDLDKAKRRQELLSKGAPSSSDSAKVNATNNHILDVLSGRLNCSFCMQLPERPVTTPCGHNFCLKCFQKWIAQGKQTCANCRHQIPQKMAHNPRINSTLVFAIRMAKSSQSGATNAPPKMYQYVHNQDRPDKAYTTERAKKSGKANACSGKVFVTVPPDHFGPILAENDPVRNMGVLVGECWEDRLECRQWGAHLPHVAGIAGQSKYGAQSVALSGGYEDDEDHGEWFLYTGSGGRDLSGNKRTNKSHSFDQTFEKGNEALRLSCKLGYPVRVVRSHKEKRSAYAPEKGVRYDGIYRIEKCWRKSGKQGFKVCRYLFVRCDNDPAPWTSDVHGDRPRPLPAIRELKNAVDLIERKGSPAWDFDDEKGCWLWKKAPPSSQKGVNCASPKQGMIIRKSKKGLKLAMKEKLLKEFSCQICRKLMANPLTTPCAHNFCKACLEGAFAGQSHIRQRTCEGRRTLRAQKNIMKCPVCPTDIADFLQNPQVNTQLMDVIESLQQKTEEMENSEDCSEESNDAHETPKATFDTADSAETCPVQVNNNLKEQVESKPHLETQKHETNGVHDMPTVDEGSPEGPDMDDSKELPTAHKPRQGNKRKKGNDGDSEAKEDDGVKTRSKKAKPAVA